MILVCGEALIDEIHGADGTRRTVPGGGPFNAARALARLGVPTAFLGRLSSDAHGRHLARLLEADGVSLELASVGDERTTTAIAEVDSAGVARYRFQIEGTSAPQLIRSMVPVPLPGEIDAIHIGSLGMVLEPMASTLVEMAGRERGRRLVALDPNIRTGLIPDPAYRARLHEVIAGATMVKASKDDLAWLWPGLTHRAAADRMLDRGVRLVAVTLGAEGAFGACAGFRVKVDAAPVRVVDTIGAGDAFGAALLAWLHDHGKIAPDPDISPDELRAALEFSCRAAATTCSRAGSDPPWKWELIG